MRDFEHFKYMQCSNAFLFAYITCDVKEFSRCTTTQEVQESFWTSFLIMNHTIKSSFNY